MRQVIVFNNKNWPLPASIVPDYLCFTAKAANSTVRMVQTGTPTLVADYEYSSDAENWTVYTVGTTLTLSNIGDKIFMRGNNTKVTESGNVYKQIKCLGDIKLSGDIRSLLSKQNFDSIDTLADYAFQNLFYGDINVGNTGISDAKDLKLAAKTIGHNTYCNLFKRCYNMVYGPASIDAENFTAQDSCSQMFQNCTSLVESPILKGNILNTGSYYAMFDGCSVLNKITTYVNSVTADLCLRSWVRNVSATGDFYNLGSATYPSGDHGIPSGWTVHTSL